ncbi:MAG TPA: NTP transferase domain-containing protein [Kofleriaceae bacterium]|jgi:CTP:molybdopterin cytidylyltransferase MocA|nr:NTP transferase domain-containing protein [Kofleriaceae bacterium]
MTEVATGPGIAAVILAAGAGRRLGGVAKALLPHPAGSSYLAAIAATAREVGLVDAVVVVGAPFGDEVAAHARQLGLRIRVNPAPERGMASSVALGFAAIAGGPAAAAWLWPVDHPSVRAVTLRRLIGALDEAGAGVEVARPRFRGVGGHPPLIVRAVWPALAACADHPDGARGVLRGARAAAVDVDDPAVIHDVDTPADREAIA